MRLKNGVGWPNVNAHYKLAYYVVCSKWCVKAIVKKLYDFKTNVIDL
jgi:hypothetical protein